MLRLGYVGVFLSGLIGSVLLASVAVADFSVEPLVATLNNSEISASASLDLDLSEESVEALEKGIPLVIVVELALHKKRHLWWDERIKRWRYPSQIRYHALSSRYIIETVDSGDFGTFHTVGDALAALGGTRRFTVKVPNSLSETKHSYRLSIRARLDIESLPAPLRLVAYISPAWRLGSGWSQWDLEH